MNEMNEMNEEMIEVVLNKLDPEKCPSCGVFTTNDFVLSIDISKTREKQVFETSYECRRCGVVWTVLTVVDNTHAAS